MADTGRVRSISLAASNPPGNVLRLRNISLRSISPADVGFIRSMQLVSGNLLPVTTDGNKTAEPGTLVTVTASCTGTVDAWTCEQISGTPVAVLGTGATRRFTAPYSIAPLPIVLRWYASQGSVVSDAALQTVTVYPQMFWYLNSTGTWIPRDRNVIASVAPGQFLDSYVDIYSEAHTT